MNLRVCAVALALVAIPVVEAAEVSVTVTNNQPAGGFSFTPLWVGFHDGLFDGFDAGSPASAALEAVAELGDATALSAAFAGSGVDDVVFSPDGPPPFTPGQSNSLMLDIGDATMNRYFSFAAMLIPSNDLFLGNDGPMAYEVFDAAGNFQGPITIEVYSDDAWDAGTEVNDIADGSAFVMGQDATLGTPEDGVVTSLFDVAGIDGYLASIVGVETPLGPITDPLGAGELIATIQIVPEPGTLAALGMGAVLTAVRRRR